MNDEGGDAPWWSATRVGGMVGSWGWSSKSPAARGGVLAFGLQSRQQNRTAPHCVTTVMTLRNAYDAV